ncbi:hypothetical protein E2562_035528 [Oryza meyeriana var. granulata]|uniref:Cytochrome b5 heme-binding domain-containing protein n=1 Tax=Oryza meyeriana var. granulata TaxID=110450 RepID=A0A6G1E5X3_9ORYZ|nr:hypothetical protein E2562_035528 [Oryza meyeriana var. granulata]
MDLPPVIPDQTTTLPMTNNLARRQIAAITSFYPSGVASGAGVKREEWEERDGDRVDATQLRAYDGSDPSKPIYISIRGKVYDATSGHSFYGPGGAYIVFAGHEASRALDKMSKDEADVSGDLSGLSNKELGVLADWETKFQTKYPVIARLTDDA